MPIRPSHSPQSMPLSEKPVRTRFGRTPAELLSSLGARVPSPYALKNGLGMMCASIRGTSSLHSLQVICAWITHNAYSLAAQFLASELHIPYTPRSIRALFALYQLPANNELTPWAYSVIACVLLRGPRDDRTEYPSLQPISWTPHPQRTLLRDVRVDHRRSHVPVPQELLNRPNVVSRLEEMRGERMAEGMATRSLRDASRTHCVCNITLHHGRVKMPAHHSAIPRYGQVPKLALGQLRRVCHETCRGKEPLPAEVARGAREFAPASVRQRHHNPPRCKITSVQCATRVQLLHERRDHRLGEDGHAILVTFSATHGDDSLRNVHVLHAQSDTLTNAKTGSVEHPRDQSRHATHVGDHDGNLSAGQHFG